MLTVCRAAAEAAAERCARSGPTARARDVFAAAAAAAREALARTPEQLPALARRRRRRRRRPRASSVILDAAETVLTGRRPVPVTAPHRPHQIPIPTPASPAAT